MKKLLLFTALCASSLSSCNKNKDVVISDSIQNTSWSVSKSNFIHYSFTKENLVINSIENPIYTNTYNYGLFHDTMYVYQQMFVYKIKFSDDSLYLTDIRTGNILTLYKF